MSSIVPALDFPQKEQYNSLAERFSLLLPQNTATPLRSLLHSRRFWRNSTGLPVQLLGRVRCAIDGALGVTIRHAAHAPHNNKYGIDLKGAICIEDFTQMLTPL